MARYICQLSLNLTMLRILIFLYSFSLVSGIGLLLLYRPKDISSDCVCSNRLRYEVSFGMGMSDTITLVLRSLAEIDYICELEIVVHPPNMKIILVFRFPNAVGVNCQRNRDVVTIFNEETCIRLCDYLYENHSTKYIVVTVSGRIRFLFMSNSSINADLNANYYQFTATAARIKPEGRNACQGGNETICTIRNTDYCFTSGVVCDGIKNCGVPDWFDERRDICDLPAERLGFPPVIAVAAAILFGILAVSHLLLRCLPPLASSFFIFNANEDNRFNLESLSKSPGSCASHVEKKRNKSLIPVFSSSSSGSGSFEDSASEHVMDPAKNVRTLEEEPIGSRRKNTMKTVTAKLQEKLWSVTRGRSVQRTGSVVDL